MFDFIFKRRTGGAPASMPPAAPPAEAVADKEAALAAAAALAGDEAAALAFLLQCEFADARLIAARQLESADMLERALAPMRKIDRRVARLLQQRLEAHAQRQQVAHRVEACLESARRLCAETALLPNQVADLDRAWQAVGTPSAAQHEEYRPLRAALEARLVAQAALQRAALDTLARLQQLQQSALAAPLPADQEIARALAILEGAMENHLASAEAAALPRHLTAEFEQRRATFRQAWQAARQQEQARAARRQALAAWADGASKPEPAELEAAWRALPALDEDGESAELERRFQTLLASLAPPPAIAAKPVARRSSAAEELQARQHAGEQLRQLEAALEEGALQAALDCDGALRALAADRVLSAGQNARLAAARAELGRLQGWARWGGNVSRGELLKTAQELPAQALPAPELARQVGALRARWKAFDASAGAAPRDAWQQFDAACSAAYAPAAAHFEEQARQRREHLAQAEALLAQMEQQAAMLAQADPAAVDWKEVAAFCARTQQAWRRLRPLERKEKKRLERAFAAALASVRAPLARQQEGAAAGREELIESALKIDPAARDATETVHRLQQRWQEMAQALPLERRREQVLWQRFRAACDAVFAQRKQAWAGAEHERREHLQQKQALCAELEAALALGPAEIRRAIAAADAAWRGIGAVPRTHERQLEQRHRAALAALQARLQACRDAAHAAGFAALRGKLALCQELERQGRAPAAAAAAAQVEGNIDGYAAAQARWQALAALAPDFEKTLQARFAAACAAVPERSQNQREKLLHTILQLEILLGVESPPHLARERLQAQVEALAAKLKSGDGAHAAREQLLALCALAEPPDAEAGARIERVLAACEAARMAGVTLQDAGLR